MNIHCLDNKDITKLSKLLNYLNLITQDIDFNNQIFICLQQGQHWTAIGGLEFYFPYALLRSVAVYPEHQGNGYAGIICESLFKRALSKNIRDLYLLTETAEGFFSKLGFIPVDRSVVPEIIKTTCQFCTLCPDNAVAMKKQLIP